MIRSGEYYSGLIVLCVFVITASGVNRGIVLRVPGELVSYPGATAAFVSTLPQSTICLDRDEIARFRQRVFLWDETGPVPLRASPCPGVANDVFLESLTSLGLRWTESHVFADFFSEEDERLNAEEATILTELHERGGVSGWTYHNYAELTALLSDLQANYLNITSLFSIGQSVQGRELWVLCIATSPTSAVRYPSGYPRPRFKWVGNMHGDETVGREALLYLLQYLLQNQNNPDVAALLADTEVCVCPSMNPDGFEAGVRRNSNGVDLNRNFPDSWDGDTNTAEGRQPETQAIMAWTQSDRFMLSANMHGGALVANYPLDTNAQGSSTYTASSDDSLFIELAKAYSFAHPTMFSSNQFQDGITNGAEWYAISGGMQDWVYTYQQGWELTLELSFAKYPSEASLDGFLNANLPSMMAYMSRSHTCAFGVVRDANTSQPISAVISGYGQPINTYSDYTGFYIRPLPANGAFTISAHATGYCSAQQNVTPDDGTPQRLDFYLEPCTDSNPGASESCLDCSRNSDEDERVLWPLAFLACVPILLVSVSVICIVSVMLLSIVLINGGLAWKLWGSRDVSFWESLESP